MINKTPPAMAKAVPKLTAPPVASSKPNIASRIRPVSQQAENFSFLVYGKSGTGKTTIASSFPKPALFLDIREKGTQSIRNVEGVSVVNIDSWSDIEEIYWYIVENPDQFKSVIIDTVTQMQDIALAQVMADDGKDPANDPTHQGHWGSTAKMMRSKIINFRDLVDKDMNVVFLAQDRSTDNEESVDQVVQEVGPRLSPSIAATLNASVHCITQTYIKLEQVKDENNLLKDRIAYKLRTGPHPVYLTKIRQPIGSYVPPSISAPSYDKIKQIMDGKWPAPVKKAPVVQPANK